jgi:hypothetical protein
VVSARGEEGLNSLVEEIRGKGGQATAVPGEVTDFEQVKAVADRAVLGAPKITSAPSPRPNPRWISSAATTKNSSFRTPGM